MPGDFDFDEPAPAAKPKPKPRVERLDDDEPRPRRREARDEDDRRERAPAGKSSFSPILIASIALGGLLVVGGGVALVFAFRTKEPDTAPKTAVASASGTAPRPAVSPAKNDPTNLTDETETRVRKATLRILVDLKDGKGASGSGFVEKNSRLVITNAHVIGALPGEPGHRAINLVVNSGEGEGKEYKLFADVIAVDTENDLALLRPSLLEVGERHIVPDGIVVQKTLTVKERHRLFIFGFPLGSQLGKEITIGETTISSLRKGDDGRVNKIQIQGGLNPGNSGGPLVDSKGNLAGVAVSGIKGTDLNFAIPADIVYEFIAKNRNK